MSETLSRAQVENICDTIAEVSIDWPVRIALSRSIRYHDAALREQLATLTAQLATVTQQCTAAIQHIEELVTTPREAQLLSKLIQAERDIESLQQCQCDGCEERLEGDAYCLRCVVTLREQLEAQSVIYQDNLTEIQLLKAQVVSREKEVLNSTVNIEDEADTIVSMDRNRREY